MICPKCKKPLYFISPKSRDTSLCIKCGHTDSFSAPQYENYHEDLYQQKTYTRTISTDPQMKKILKKLKIDENESVLDIGCGVGDYTKEIHNLYNKNVIGIDLSVLAARKKYPSVNFTAHDCNKKLPFDDSSFDKIISINLIEHLIEFENFLDECKRVLKPGGKIALTTANRDFFLHNYFFDKTHVHEWTIKEFENFIKEHFNVECMEKSSSMFKYYPLNFITTKILKPDLLLIGNKK